MKRFFSCFFIIIMIFGIQQFSFAKDTFIVVHVRAHDAKFIGSSMGGALIIIRNAETGEILDKGLTSGGTGDTKLIMQTPHKRGMRLTNDNTAEFRTVLYITKPTLLTIEAHAPGNMKSPMVASTQVWAIPGKHILGDGIILTMYGFAVSALSPKPDQSFPLNEEKGIPLKAHIVMMCGCPVTPNGMWNANKYTIQAIIRKNNKTVKVVTMKYAGQKNTFSTNVNLNESGSYEAYIYAYDSKTGNTGVAKTKFTIQP